MKWQKFPEEHEVHRVAIIGDWHSNHPYAMRVLQKAKEAKVEVLLHLGDFNLSEGPLLEKIEKFLAEHQILLLLIDGNHDNHAFLSSLPVREDGVRPVTEHIWHLPRGFTWEWFGVRCMALGGSSSVNRQKLVEGVNWWEEERITWEDMVKACQQGKIDVLFSHDCPTGVTIPGLDNRRSPFPQEELIVAETQRALLYVVCQEVQPSQVFHGHYHTRYSQETTFPWGSKVKVEGLGRDGDPIKENLIIFNFVTGEIEP